MKKIIALSLACLVAASAAFALDPITGTVEINTTINESAQMNVNKKAVTSGELSATDFTAQALVDKSVFGDTFYVNTRSNLGKGFSLSYTVSPLASSDANNPDKIAIVIGSKADSGAEVLTDVTAKTTVNVLATSTTTGMENHSVAIRVKAKSATWKTDVRADSYSSDLTFTFTAN